MPSRNQQQNKSGRGNRGFTLIETLVAILIVSIAIATATQALQQALQTSNYVKDQITAYYLAEDSLEYIVAQRDTTNSTPGGWMSASSANGLLQCVQTDQAVTYGVQASCVTDTYSNSLAPCIQTGSGNYQGFFNNAQNGSYGMGVPYIPPQCTAGMTLLAYCSDTNAYLPVSDTSGDSSCTPTKFNRVVTITPIQLVSGNANDVNAYNEVVVTATVSWSSGYFANQAYTLSEDLYNW